MAHEFGLYLQEGDAVQFRRGYWNGIAENVIATVKFQDHQVLRLHCDQDLPDIDIYLEAKAIPKMVLDREIKFIYQPSSLVQ